MRWFWIAVVVVLVVHAFNFIRDGRPFNIVGPLPFIGGQPLDEWHVVAVVTILAGLKGISEIRKD